jgi:alpha-tubulin suppressor-like RCC1 family protein
MGRCVPKRSLRCGLIVVAGLAVAAGCGTDPPAGPTGDYTIALNPTSASVVRGGNTTVQVSLTRSGGFTGAVAVALENAPAGVTGVFVPTPAPGASSTITVSASGEATLGQYPLTVRGTTPGLADRTAALFLVVTSPASGSVTTVVTTVNQSCALNAAGQAYCWGHNGGWGGGGGNLGAPSTETCLDTPCSTRPVAVTGGFTFTTLSGFWNHICGLTAGGAAYCWGNNFGGRLGDGTTTSRTVPTPVAGDPKFASISVGQHHTCGVTTSGAAYCWGHGSASGGSTTEGQLGDGTTSGRLVPTPVVGGLSFTAVSTGMWHTCGITTSGAAHCWGFNNGGQLGDGTTTNRLVPTPVAGARAFSSISAAGSTCGVTTSGEAYCWGGNSNGVLGDGTTTERLLPTPVAGSHRFTDVRIAEMHTCGVTTGAAALCWGRNEWGQLGDGTGGTGIARQVPTPVVGGHAFAAVSTGGSIFTGAHTCGVTRGGLAYCWGANHYGQVGDGTTANGRVVPTGVAFP